MGGLFGNKYIANFHDKKGNFLFWKCFKTSWKKNTLTHFETEKDGYYLVEGSPIKFSPFPYFFDYYMYNYEHNNPLPIRQSQFGETIKAKSLRVIIKNTILEQLMKVRNKTFGEFLTLRNILIIGAIGLGLLWWYNGGSFGDILNVVDDQIKPGSLR